MASDDVNYLEKRAEAELELAQRATHASAVRAHYEMASAYLDRIYEDAAAAPEQA